MIKGPTDADHYRVKVGNWGERWYTDPLPATKHIEASDATFPSISTVKKASGQDWSFVSLKRVADAEPERLHQIADLPGPERYDAITSINKRGLGRAAERGTNVHLYAESLLRGTQPPLMTEGYPGWNYIKAVDDFFSTYNPKLYAAEYPVFHRTLNGVGYGGTPDGIVEIGGKLYGIDWKTRTETSDHGAYPEEAAQIAAGAFAEYMIVEDADGNAVRQPVPQLAGGLIVSIRPDGCRVFPLDLAVAWDHWTAMHAWWVARRTEKVSIGKPWAPGKRQSEAKPKRIEPPTVAAPVAPAEGDPVTDVDDIRTRYLALDPVARAWVDGKRSEALSAGVDFHLAGCYTQRRVALMCGLITLAEHDEEPDMSLTGILDQFDGPPPTAGHLDWQDAVLFADACARYIGQPVTIDRVADMFGAKGAEPAREITARRLPTMRLRELLDNWTPGSGTGRWTWIDEDRWLWEQQPTEMAALCDDIRANGIREPILLGGDGRVWDGHHRVCAAMFIGLDRVPIEHALGADPSYA